MFWLQSNKSRSLPCAAKLTWCKSRLLHTFHFSIGDLQATCLQMKIFPDIECMGMKWLACRCWWVSFSCWHTCSPSHWPWWHLTSVSPAMLTRAPAYDPSQPWPSTDAPTQSAAATNNCVLWQSICLFQWNFLSRWSLLIVTDSSLNHICTFHTGALPPAAARF